jgi:hypothetical protein
MAAEAEAAVYSVFYYSPPPPLAELEPLDYPHV